MSGPLSGNTTVTASLFNSTAWTTGDLQTYLGISGTPNNPIGAYIQPSGANGWWVYQASISGVTLPGGPNDAYTLLLGQNVPLYSYITAFIGSPTTGSYDATAPSGALREVPLPEPATWAMMLLGFGGIGMAMRRSRKADGKLLQLA
jgi:hypothetical protein